jgi:hypothetical protein
MEARRRRAGTEACRRRAVAEARPQWPAVRERGCGARHGRAGVRASEARASGRDKGLSYWAGPYRRGRYVSGDVSIFAKKKIRYSCTYRRRMDTYPYPPVHINGVADTYQHPIRIRYGIRSARDASV